MQKTDLDGLNPREEPRNRRSVSQPLAAEDFALNYYELEPGEGFSGTVHAHQDQEETFVILDGEATFEHTPEPDAETETTRVSEGEVIRFAKGEYQSGRNASDDTVRALAMGTPQDSRDVRVAAPCEDCGESAYMEFVVSDGDHALECPACGSQVET